MDLKVYAVGRGFGDTSELKSVVDLLKNYEVAFDRCLKRSCQFHNVRPESVHLRLNTAEPGSLDVRLVTEIAAAVAPLAPQIFGYAWQLYKLAYDLIMIATDYFKRKGHPVNVQITNSPGAVVNIVNGDLVQTSNDVLNTARAIHPFLDKIADLIKGRMADRISLEANSKDVRRPILEFSRANKDSFRLPEQDAYDDELIELECEIYRFHKKSLNGLLGYQDDGERQVKPFTIKHELRDSCIESMKSSSAIVTAYREMTTNALGETKIKKFHIVSISTDSDAP